MYTVVKYVRCPVCDASRKTHQDYRRQRVLCDCINGDLLGHREAEAVRALIGEKLKEREKLLRRVAKVARAESFAKLLRDKIAALDKQAFFVVSFLIESDFSRGTSITG